MRCGLVTSGWGPGRLWLGGLELRVIVSAYSQTECLSPAGGERTSLKCIGMALTTTSLEATRTVVAS
jgi:hypothetical protein